MASKIDVFNMALGHIGVNSTVADEQERSPERVACSRFWDQCRDALLAYKSMPWSFSLSIVPLAEIATQSERWAFRYRYPSDCINIVDLVLDSDLHSMHGQRVPYQVAFEADSRVILTNLERAHAVYVKRITEVERWPATFVEAMSYRLAAMIAMPLKNDAGMRNDQLELAERFAQIAMADMLNESAQDEIVPSVYERELHA